MIYLAQAVTNHDAMSSERVRKLFAPYYLERENDNPLLMTMISGRKYASPSVNDLPISG